MSINEILYDITFNSLKKDLLKKMNDNNILGIIASFCCKKIIKPTINNDLSKESIESLCYMNYDLPPYLLGFGALSEGILRSLRTR